MQGGRAEAKMPRRCDGQQGQTVDRAGGLFVREIWARGGMVVRGSSRLWLCRAWPNGEAHLIYHPVHLPVFRNTLHHGRQPLIAMYSRVLIDRAYALPE